MIRYIFTLLFLFSVLSPLNGHDSLSLTTTLVASAPNPDGSYRGKMDVTMGKGKTFTGREATYEIRHGKLYCDFPKIGKMPGKIRLELPIKISSDGRITAHPGTIAGAMKLPLGIKVKLKLISLTHAQWVGHQLSFVMKVYGQFMGATFPTTVSFSGVEQN